MSQQTVTPLQPTSKFEILRRKNAINNASSIYNSGSSAAVGTEVAARGLGLGAKTDNTGAFDLAQPTNFIGHLTRRVVIGGLQLADRVFGVSNPVPVGVESPFTDGLEVSLERGEEIEAEGIGTYLYSGANAITTGTAPGVGLTYQNGLLRVAQSGEISFFVLTVNNLPSVDPGALRIRAVAN